jgi:hypothetical protein
MKKGLFLLCVAGIAYFLYSSAIWYLTDGFSLGKIRSNLKFSSKWEVVNPAREAIVPLLSQNFYYLGRGSQMYVFESEDKQLILKFFRHNRYRLASITHSITSPIFLADMQSQKRKAKQAKLNALFQSCKIGYEELHEESGLLYLHLNKTRNLKTSITLYDKLKRAYTIPIDDYEFILQKHGEHIYPYLTRLIDQGKTKEAEAALTDLIFLLTSRLNKGIIDHDAVIHKNSGFLANKALFLDVGEFSKAECKDLKEELWHTTRDLRSWLQEKDPALALTFEKIIIIYQSGYRRLPSPVALD